VATEGVNSSELTLGDTRVAQIWVSYVVDLRHPEMTTVDVAEQSTYSVLGTTPVTNDIVAGVPRPTLESATAATTEAGELPLTCPVLDPGGAEPNSRALRFDQPGEFRVEILHDLIGAATAENHLPAPYQVFDAAGSHSWWAGGLQLPGVAGGLGEVIDWARSASTQINGYTQQVRFMYDLIVRSSGVSFLSHIAYPAALSFAAGLGYTTRALVVRRRDPDMLIYRNIAAVEPDHIPDVAAVLREKREAARARRGGVSEVEECVTQAGSVDDF
jgi:hypothetical protein